MSKLTNLPHRLDAETFECRAIIETPRGCRNKYDYDPESGLFELGGLLPEGIKFLKEGSRAYKKHAHRQHASRKKKPGSK